MGADYFFELKPQVKKTFNEGFQVVNTEIGSIIAAASNLKGSQGGVMAGGTLIRNIMVPVTQEVEHSNNQTLDQFRKLELLGVTESSHEKEDEEAMR